jgi:purine-cytosine permease-like protein
MVFCRYSWGYYGASIMSIFNVIAALCWASIISITGAQTLRVVSNDSLSISVGIILISIITMIVSFLGYKWIHIYERYLWIPVFIVFSIIAVIVTKNFSHSQMVIRGKTVLIMNEILYFR